MRRVILDTNFILSQFQFRVDIFSEIARLIEGRAELVTISPVVSELKKLGRPGSQGIELIKRKNIKIIEAKGNADREIVKIASKRDVVCTNDRELRSKLREKDIPVIFLRQKKYLEAEGL